MKTTEKEIIKAYGGFSARYKAMNFELVLQYLLYEFLSFLPKGAKILDAGCGPGRDSLTLKEEGCEVVGIDITPEMIELAKESAPKQEFLAKDMRKTGFKDESFDGIWANASVIHLPKQQMPGLLKEFSRILKPSGILFVSVLKGEGEKSHAMKYFYEGELPVSFYDKDEFSIELERSGFRVLRCIEDADDHDEWLNFICRKKQ
jgi:ubiquinone/menaquinone biosynthesis C-methylase UbiE